MAWWGGDLRSFCSTACLEIKTSPSTTKWAVSCRAGVPLWRSPSALTTGGLVKISLDRRVDLSPASSHRSTLYRRALVVQQRTPRPDHWETTPRPVQEPSSAGLAWSAAQGGGGRADPAGRLGRGDGHSVVSRADGGPRPARDQAPQRALFRCFIVRHASPGRHQGVSPHTRSSPFTHCPESSLVTSRTRESLARHLVQ